MAILCYHAVARGWQSPLALSPEQFARHCDWLDAHRRVIPLGDAIQARTSSTAITFDDGLEGVHRYALPALAVHALPATVFLVAATLTGGGREVDWIDDPPPEPLPTLSRAQVLEMQAAGITFGSHSYAHRDLTRLSADECESDLRASREVLEDLLGRPVQWLAYPRGLHNDQVRQAAARAGFTHAFTLPQGREAVMAHALPRVGIWARDGIAALRLKTSDWYAAFRGSRAFPVARALRHLGRRGAPA